MCRGPGLGYPDQGQAAPDRQAELDVEGGAGLLGHRADGVIADLKGIEGDVLLVPTTVAHPTIAEVAAMDKQQVLDMVGIELSPMRIKCAVLGLLVLKLGAHEHAGTDMPAGWEGMDEIAWEQA